MLLFFLKRKCIITALWVSSDSKYSERQAVFIIAQLYGVSEGNSELSIS